MVGELNVPNILEEEEVKFFILPLSIYTIFATIFLAKILPLHPPLKKSPQSKLVCACFYIIK
jgi:hypothetical protein